MLSAAEAADLLGTSYEEIEGLRASRSILAVRVGNEWRYPELQFADERPLPRLEEIIRAHHGVDGWVVLDSLLALDSAYGGRSILMMLIEGDDESLDQVLRELHRQYAS
ncbi:helix-turn-helix domain-containing protein [Sulfitobacter sp. 1A12126]|uniref:helix-turn-helix domain-containing protein n=1 Tax=Sulfitobacter sp. 1A12126 TaxID=3368591 RepID=UPI00374547D9